MNSEYLWLVLPELMLQNKQQHLQQAKQQRSERFVCLVGGIRLRLRDRDLLKKRKAEAEERQPTSGFMGKASVELGQ